MMIHRGRMRIIAAKTTQPDKNSLPSIINTDLLKLSSSLIGCTKVGFVSLTMPIEVMVNRSWCLKKWVGEARGGLKSVRLLLTHECFASCKGCHRHERGEIRYLRHDTCLMFLLLFLFLLLTPLSLSPTLRRYCDIVRSTEAAPGCSNLHSRCCCQVINVVH